MDKHHFKKALGQNFLRSGKYAQTLVQSINPQPGDTVIEIGPGDGSITNLLFKLPLVKLISIEYDYSLIPKLVKRFGEFEHFELIHKNILEVNLAELITPGLNYKVIGSLPYNISKEIIEKFIQADHKPTVMGFIVQEEVAAKFAAVAPDATLIGNQLQARAAVKKVKTIPAQYFFPRPKVNGAILQIIPQPEAVDPELFKLMKIGFQTPRKTLRNNLHSSRKWDSPALDQAWQQLGFSANSRANEISLSEWRKLLQLLQ